MKHTWIILLLIAVTGATYCRACFCEFTSWDDPDTIASNPRLEPASFVNVMHYWRHPAAGLYIPLTYTFWSLLAGIARQPAVFHAANVILHIWAVLLVFAILRQLVDSDAASVVGALVFALHPLQAEAVAWASGTKDLLAAVFSLTMIDQIVRLHANPQNHGRWRYAAALLAFGLAILSKPSAAMAPLIAGILAWICFPQNAKQLVAQLAPMLILASACVVWSRAAQAAHPPTDTPLWARPLIAADAIAFYLWKLVYPINLGIIYGRTPRAVFDQGIAYFSWIAPLLAAVALGLTRKRTPWPAAGAAVFVIGLLPMLGFARFEFQIHSTVADHYVYLPMLGIALAVAGVVALRPSKQVVAACGAVLAVLAMLCIRQLRHWQDSEALFAQALRVNPTSLVARDGLAKALAGKGQLDDAIQQFRMVMTMSPQSRLAHTNLGQALWIAGRLDDATAELHTALRLAREGEDVSREQFLLDELRRQKSTTGPSTISEP